MGYIDGSAPDPQSNPRGQVQRDKDRATAFDRQVLFSAGGTYRGTAEQLARLAARAGKPVETPEGLARRMEALRVANEILPDDYQPA